jgi:hypothetical protein
MVGGAISPGGDTEWGCARVLLRKSGKVQETGRFGEKGGEGGGGGGGHFGHVQKHA